MILSTGIDIVEVYRIRDILARTPRFATRVFTEREREYCDERGAGRARSYAARFAAKEAFLKALKTGWRGKITWHDVEVIVDDDGVPSLNITGEAARLLTNLEAGKTHISLSHTSTMAIAQIVIEEIRVDSGV